MLYALATPNSSFKPSIRKMKNSWRLKKFKQLYIEKGGLSANSSSNSGSGSSVVSFTESASSKFASSPLAPSVTSYSAVIEH
ncbi:hypothetical protein I9W82_000051 [Candida metapsilosis]|uniref:Uncharacterized protein n=1 Tax=Candida metapsilosis TaxID=273372 RepID=A0A8H7ZKQ7_9ASCO|nr:hypothetical protein I9W82_000051 [Candida metapsilosis]